MTNLSIDEQGWLQSVEVIESPNFDARPDGTAIKLVVVHGISLPPREFGGGYIQQFFCNQLDPSIHPYFETIYEMKVSAHALIERSGKLIQFVSFYDRAWHAGQSEWCGESACNNFSIGIELEGCDDEPYSEAQYQSLSQLIRVLQAQFTEIGKDSITGHSNIAPGRKTDPGPAFDWCYLMSLL